MSKILFVIGSMVGGGAERVISVLSNKLCNDGIDVKILSIYGASQDYCIDERVKLITLNCNSNNRCLRIISRILSMRKVIRELHPDCVVSFLAEVNMMTLISLLGNHEFPVIISERNDPNMDPPNRLIRKLRNVIYSRADGFVFQTPDAKKYFDKYLNKDSNCTIIPNPVTPDLPYHRCDIECKRLITACRLAEQKNLDMMIDAVTEVICAGIDCRLDIFGVGPLEESLRKHIEDLNMSEHITLCGFSKNIHDEMNNSAAFLITSNYEGISNSMIEALAIGLPVIATDCPVGGARMFIEDGVNGYLIPTNDKSALVHRIVTVLTDPDVSRTLSSNASSVRDELDISIISQKWMDYISGTINSYKENN